MLLRNVRAGGRWVGLCSVGGRECVELEVGDSGSRGDSQGEREEEGDKTI